MKTRTAFLLVAACLLLGGIVQAQTGGPGRTSVYVVQAGTTSGGGYQLTSLRWQVSGVAAGGSYGLVAADQAAGGNQCCCTYLPVILRNK